MLYLHRHCEIQLLYFCCVGSEACACWARAVALSWHSKTQFSLLFCFMITGFLLYRNFYALKPRHKQEVLYLVLLFHSLYVWVILCLG